MKTIAVTAVTTAITFASVMNPVTIIACGVAAITISLLVVTS